MKGFFLSAWNALSLGLALGASVVSGAAQSLSPGTVWVYNLTEGGRIVDDCPICDRIPIVAPLRGTYELRLNHYGPLFTYYDITNINFSTSSAPGREYKVRGHGSFQIGGEISVFQSATLEVTIDNGVTNDLCYFTNISSIVTRLWPMMQISFSQTNGTATQQYYLDLNTAPLREIWFSAASDFVAGIWNAPSNRISGGDLLATSGLVVKRNEEFAGRLSPMPPAPDVGLKDIDILPGGEIAFSMETDLFSEVLGPLSPGDLLSDQGRVLRTNASLIAAFAPTPADGVGLSAVQIMPSGSTWFSVQTRFHSQSLNQDLFPGDLLSDDGTLVKSNAQLLALFKPLDSSTDFGLRAIHVWPGGEIWFSTSKAFDSADGTHYEAGDLLSDHGYLVFRESELLSAFAPSGVSTNTNIGIDSLFVVTDVAPNEPAPTLSMPYLTNQPPASIAFAWKGRGRVFQLERTINPAGPYVPVSLITTDKSAIDPGVQTNQAQSFYRLHQW
jgi:hypothetical protein